MNHLNETKRQFNIMANDQEDKGIEKYGKPLDPLDNYDWLIMAREELTDTYKYLVAEQEKRKFIADKIHRLTNDPEILHWLDVLKGNI